VSRRKGWLFFVFGLILALGAGAMVFVVLNQAAQAAPTAAPPVPTLRLPVAARPLEPGLTLGSADYVLKDFPLDLVPVSAISETADLEGQYLVNPVGQGETFNKAQFLGSQAATLSQQIQPGKVLFAFPIVDLMSKSNLIQDGDYVDLLLTIGIDKQDGQEPEKVTAYTLQNIEVFKVLRTAAQEGQQVGDPAALLCSLTPEQAVLIKAVKDAEGTIDFTLRSPADKEPYQAPSYNEPKLIERFDLN
jgi:pilus assembly protein CpaB